MFIIRNYRNPINPNNFAFCAYYAFISHAKCKPLGSINFYARYPFLLEFEFYNPRVFIEKNRNLCRIRIQADTSRFSHQIYMGIPVYHMLNLTYMRRIFAEICVFIDAQKENGQIFSEKYAYARKRLSRKITEV